MNLRVCTYPGHSTPALAHRWQPGRVSSHLRCLFLHRSQALFDGTPGMVSTVVGRQMVERGPRREEQAETMLYGTKQDTEWRTMCAGR